MNRREPWDDVEAPGGTPVCSWGRSREPSSAPTSSTRKAIQQATAEDPSVADLLEQARRGDQEGLNELLARYRPRLLRMVEVRLAPQVRARVDASDIIQETFLEATRRLDRYLNDQSMPFFGWLRFLTRQKLVAIHRHHLGTRARDPRCEVALSEGAHPDATGEALAARLLGHSATPSRQVARAEMQLKLQGAIASLEPLEREVLVLRHFEQLSNRETARELGIGEAAASKRHIRALYKLRGILLHLQVDPGGD